MRFADLVGHAHVKDLLLRTARRGRVPHAWLFEGPEGVGKRTMALALLSWLCCRNRTDDDSCGACIPCRQVTDLSFVDLKVLKPDEKGSIKIDPLREEMPRLLFDPLVGPWKCLLIDDAHAMTLEAANAALKTLEEPPSNTLFVLVTPTPDILPRTIVSRCLSVSFGPVGTEDVMMFLLRQGVAADVARAAAALGRGSPGLALRHTTSEVLAERTDMIRQFLEVANGGAAARLALADELASDKDQVDERLDILESLVRDVLLAAVGAPDAALANADLAGEIRTFAEAAGPERALEMVQALLDRDAMRRYTPGARIALDRLMLS